MNVQTGIDRVATGAVSIEGRVALCAHPASVDRTLRHTRWVLADRDVQLVSLFGPEHGYGGEAQDMIGVGDARDPAGLPIHSLYGATEETLSPTDAQLDGLDAVVVDLQDVGSRYYTYVWTAALILKKASRLGIKTIVLDRPNPLGGVVVESAPQRPGFRSFVGLYDVSVRHGMTLGEIVTMVRRLEGIDEDALEVVRMDGWDPAMRFDQTGLPWVLPSPNMPTLDTAVVYPGGCAIEGTALSEGRGQTRPFEIWGAPGLDGRALADSLSLEGATLRPMTFTPTFQKHAGVLCGGVQVHVTDRDRFRSYEAYLRMIHAAAAQLGERFEWRPDPYEFVGDIPAIDLLTGDAAFRAAVDAGAPLDHVLQAERAGAEAFDAERQPWLLYPR
ncbi:MAG: exo-beta-N-acetylmuramidase NamZ domain-containing protein [Sandaracinaceae bacterium]